MKSHCKVYEYIWHTRATKGLPESQTVNRIEGRLDVKIRDGYRTLMFAFLCLRLSSLQTDGNRVESVYSFLYLGSLQKSEGNSHPDMKRISHVFVKPHMALQRPSAEHQHSSVGLPGLGDVRIAVYRRHMDTVCVMKERRWKHFI